MLREGADGIRQIVYAEHHERSPAGRWYSQAQAVAVYQAAVFTRLRVTSEFTPLPARGTNTLFCVSSERAA
ncbi:MAG: hypothetical protein ACUVSX_16800 [Aggregatilineales bacterium]